MAEDENKRRIIDQSALMQNIDEIKKLPINGIKEGPYVIGISEDEERPDKDVGFLVNKLYNFSNFIKSYNSLSSADVANLIPYIQIWKVYEDGEPDFLIPFNNFYPKSSIEAITSGRSDRGYQANLVNVEFISQGKDTATTFIYQVKLNIIFDSVQTIFNDKSRYLELFNPPKKLGKYKRGDGDPKYYQIKLKFGWNIASVLPESINAKDLQNFVNVSGSEVFLNYVMHKITINEDGSVSLQIEYIGSIEAIARNSNKLSLLSDEKIQEINKINEEIQIIEDRLKENNITVNLIKEEQDKPDSIKIELKDSDGNDVGEKRASDKSDLTTKYNQLEKFQTEQRGEFINGIMRKISQQYRGYFPFLKIDKAVYNKRKELYDSYTKINEIRQIEEEQKLANLERSSSVSIEKENIVADDSATVKDQKELDNYYLKLSNTNNENNTVAYTIPFFTFGALLKAIPLDKEYIILSGDCKISTLSERGDTGYIDGSTIEKNPDYKIFVDNGLKIQGKVAVIQNHEEIYNILDIPIALSTFKYWITKNVTSQNLSKMNLINFLNLCVNDLLNLAVKSSNEDYIPKQNINFKFFFDRVVLNKNNEFLKLIEGNDKRVQIIGKSVYQNIKNFLTEERVSLSNSVKKNIIIFYAIPRFLKRKKNVKEDIEDGIPHFYYGSSKGIINKITFREENMPFVREANIQSQVNNKPWKPGVFIRSKYNVTLEMIGTVNFRIGSMIYISPSFPGVQDLQEPVEYGIGGYFIIISIKTSIDSGKYITIIEANWVATGNGDYTDLSHFPIRVKKLSQTLQKTQEERFKMSAQEMARLYAINLRRGGSRVSVEDEEQLAKDFQAKINRFGQLDVDIRKQIEDTRLLETQEKIDKKYLSSK